MKVSVVIPAYNEEKYIKNCLDSLKYQEVQADEIIVVDNNCTDNTIDIAKQFNVRVVKEKKQGMANARTRGFNEAKHEIIARCDADSILSPNWIRRIKYNFEKRKKIDGLIGTVNVYDFPMLNVKLVGKALVYLIKEAAGHFPLYGSSMAISKKIWDKIKKDVCLDDEIVHEDVDLSVHIHESGGTIVFDPLFEAKVSARRLKRDPYEFLIEYPLRIFSTIKKHRAGKE